MRTFDKTRTVWLLALGVAVACGSEDGSKKVPSSGGDGAGEGGVESGSDAAGESSGGTTPNGGTTANAGAGASAVGSAGEAGNAAEGGGAGMEAAAGAGGAVDPGPRECPVGTADCDDDHADCETNTATDATNCGRCERACGATAACNGGLCDPTVILSPSGNLNFCDWAFSATTAYLLTCWGTFSEIRSAPLEPAQSTLGNQIKAYTVPVVAARGMIIDGNDVLFGIEENPSHLYKFPLGADGAEDVSVAYTFENGKRFDSLLLVGDTFYWSHNTHTAGGQVQPGYIEKRSKAGNATTVLVTGLGLNYGLQVFDDLMIWLERRTVNDVLSVYRAPIGGAPVGEVELVAAAANGGYMARRDDYVYWTHKAAAPNGKLRRILANSPTAKPQDIATNLNLPEGLVTDEAYAYFKQLDALYRVPLTGGTAEQLSPVMPAHDAQATQVMHVDAKYVYLAVGATAGQSSVVRVAK